MRDRLYASTNAFAVALYSQLRQKEANLFFSPFSVIQAVSMVLLGAKGETHAEIEAMLTLDGSAPAHDTSQVETCAHVAERQAARTTSTGTTFRVANALWAGAGVSLEATFAEHIERKSGGLIASVDFADERGARDRINSWVSAQTEGKIHNLIGHGALTSSTRLVLTNAIYFKSAWASPFAQARTERLPFHCLGGKDVAVDMMHARGPFQLACQDGVKVLTIPYRDGRMSMIVVLPDEADGLDVAEARLTSNALNFWIQDEEKVRVDLALPKFESGSSLSLRDTLVTLGMRQAFEPAAADLRGITPDPLFVGDVVHQSFVRVNEAGTEATAATSVMTPRGSSAAAPATPFVADHPFLYLIQEEESGEIIFMGRMVDPTVRD